jgi:hypothetical protein
MASPHPACERGAMTLKRAMRPRSVAQMVNRQRGEWFQSRWSAKVSANDGPGRRGHDGQARAVETQAAVDMVLHHHDGDQHDGSGHAAKDKSNNSETATVSHHPLPEPACSFVGRALTLVQKSGLIFAERPVRFVDKPAGRG